MEIEFHSVFSFNIKNLLISHYIIFLLNHLIFPVKINLIAHLFLLLTIKNAYATAVVSPFDLTRSFGWYDFSIKLPGNYLFEKRFAGHVETGHVSKSDPAMG